MSLTDKMNNKGTYGSIFKGYKLNGIKKIFKKSQRNDPVLGELLVQKGIITDDQRNCALDIQKEKLFREGKILPIGHIIVDAGFARETDVVTVINDHYSIFVNSLSDNIKELVSKVQNRIAEDLPKPGFPIWFQLSVTIMVLLAIALGGLSWFFLHRQEGKLYNQAIKMGMISLHYFESNAKVPLLKEDVLALNTIVNNASGVEGHVYASIIDNNHIIKAHTDAQKIDKLQKKVSHGVQKTLKGDIKCLNYFLSNGKHILDLSKKISFNDKTIGEVHVGLSLDFISQIQAMEKGYIALITLFAIFSGGIIAVLVGLRFSRPISKLTIATKHIGLGNYNYRVNVDRNDEFGRLAESFNNMSSQLNKQSLMKKSFGKYVGPEVLNMIMDDPEKLWLKGRRNEATILFTDLRGFTAYSEAHSPEILVEKLNEYFEIATNIISKHGGYTDKFIGDGVLGVFGVPVYHKDHCERCLKAALEMQEEFLKRSNENSNNPLLKRVGIGINTGVVLAGNIGSPAKMEYTVIGNSVNFASRLSDLAEAGEIIVDDTMLKCMGHKIDFQKLSSRVIKGKSEPVDIFRVTGLKGNRNGEK